MILIRIVFVLALSAVAPAGLVLLISGIQQKEHAFNSLAVSANSGLLLVGYMALSLPTLYVSLAPETSNDLQVCLSAQNARRCSCCCCCNRCKYSCGCGCSCWLWGLLPFVL